MKRILACLAAVAVLGFSVPAAAVEGSRSTSFTFALSTTAERAQISASVLTKYKTIRCLNLSAIIVYFGDSGSQVYPVCSDAATCDSKALTVNTRNLWVKSASGTPNLTCIIVR